MHVQQMSAKNACLNKLTFILNAALDYVSLGLQMDVVCVGKDQGLILF